MKQPSGVRLSQGMQPMFTDAVVDVLADQQGIVEEDLLSLALADLVLFDALALIAFIPIEAFDPPQLNHSVYYHHIQPRQGLSPIAMAR
jgi:hypothetical protein